MPRSSRPPVQAGGSLAGKLSCDASSTMSDASPDSRSSRFGFFELRVRPRLGIAPANQHFEDRFGQLPGRRERLGQHGHVAAAPVDRFLLGIAGDDQARQFRRTLRSSSTSSVPDSSGIA